MKFSKKIFTILFGLAIMVYIVISFYFYQKTMQKQHIAFVTTINRLINDNLTVNYDILSTSIFAYNNEDIIAKDTKKFKQEYNKLKSLKILTKDSYSTLNNSIKVLGYLVNKKLDDITYFLILNSNIKNSLIFLLNYAPKNRSFFKNNINIKHGINTIIDKISNARKTQDKNYLNNLKLLTPLQNLNKNQINYIDTFNLHAAYISTHFNNFLSTVSSILNNSTTNYIDKINKKFNMLTKKDDVQLNRQIIFILIITVMSAFIMIILVMRLNKENMRLKKVKLKLSYQASHDNLTGLLNRFTLENTLKRNKNHLLILIDIDRFKHINDFYGTDIGNIILQAFAKIIQIPHLNCYSPLYYRAGGDIFAILLANITLENALKMAEKLSTIISSHTFDINDINISLDAKIALNNTNPLLENADMALKDIKSKNEKNIIIFNENLDLKEQIKLNIYILSLVSEAIKENRVVAYFQPILNLKTQTIEKYEALVRIIKEDKTILPPIAFLPIIQNTELYYHITRIMMNEVLKIAKINQKYRFSLNLSMQDIANDKLMEMLFNKLDTHQENGANIDIELLETENLYDTQKVKEFITHAHKYGCHVLIDDFGTGYSNFAYLSELNVDILKIDASIVKNILINDKMMKTLKIIKQFATAINVQTVAEFVDTKEILDEIQEIGIDYAQGYFIGKPTPPPPRLLDGDGVSLL